MFVKLTGKRILFFCLLFSCTLVASQSSIKGIDSAYFKVRILKLNLFSPLIEAFGIGYEVSTSPSSSIQVNGLFGNRGFLITPEYRYYLSETPTPKGVFVAPFVNYGNADGDDIFGGGLVIGYQNFFKKKITIDVFFGPSYQMGTYFDQGQFLVRGGIFIGLNLRKPPL
jgi:hypothetical protein